MDVAEDHRDLARFGYKQELDRSLGSFSSFAAGFSYISILTGLFQTFHLGFAAGGPAFFGTWPIVLAGQFLVALCFAELAAHYPLSGSVYQWSKQIGHRAAGWLAGWLFLACLIVTLAAVALAVNVTLPQISSWFHLIGNPHDATDRARNAVLWGCILIAFSTLINAVGVGVLAKINNAGVFSELIAVILLIVLLAAHACRGPEVVLETQARGEGSAFGYAGAFLAAMTLTASYVLYGYDTAGALAEETHDPRRKAPRAILQALGAAAVAGALLLFVALLAAPDIHNPLWAQEDGGLPAIVNQTLGTGLGAVFLSAVIFAIIVCALAVHTGIVRLMFAMARDNNLPFGAALAKVSPSTRTPIVPAVVAGVLAAAILLVNVNYPHVVSLVTAIAILWANLAYLFATVLLLERRLRGWPPRDCERGGFSLGRWGLPVNVLAVLWGVFMVVNIAWPRAQQGDSSWYAYAPFLITGGLLLVGGLYYAFVQRHKTGILAEHRARAGDTL